MTGESKDFWNEEEGKCFNGVTIEGKLMNKKERKAKHRALKPISKKHPEFELAYDMMLGIRTVVGRAEATQSLMENQFSMQNNKVKKLPDLASQFQDDFVDQMSPEQFSECFSYRFPNKGSKCTPPHYMKSFKFKDYCPHIFKMLRQMFDIDPTDYQMELCGNFQYLEFISNSKSGQFFFYSHDQRYMVKTMTKTESKLLRKILPQYYGYIRKHPWSLLTKYFGMHRVKPHRRKKIYFLIMGSVFFSKPGLEIHEQYDLKGSTVGRRSQKNETMKKDLDLIESGTFVQIGRERAKMFRMQIQMDTDFLRKNQIMDYSLLLGIHHRDRDARTYKSTKSLSPAPRHSEKDKIPKHPVYVDWCSKSEEVLISMTNTQQISQPTKKPKPTLVQLNQSQHYKFTNPLTRRFIIPEMINDTEVRSSEAREEVSDEAPKNPFTSNYGGMFFQDLQTGRLGNKIYFVGIIDILQKYNRHKRLENFVKSRMNDSEAISSVDPNSYSRRFNRFFTSDHSSGT
jgi:1-phosphatidylinositol-4-phosphate 5-kinase